MAYRIELTYSFNEIVRTAHDEIFSLRLQMKLNPPIAATISSDQKEDFIIKDDFTHPQGWI